jgi:hypothetical protein
MNVPEQSIWVGSVAPEISDASRSRWSDSHDRDLYRLVVDEGRVLIMIGRNSSASGRAGAKSAAQDLLDVVEDLARSKGLDIRDDFPTRDELVEMLMASKNTMWSKTRDGRRFLSRFVLIDLSHLGVIASLSTGSAKMVDADGKQPHIYWIQRLLREIAPAPAGFFAKRFDRVTRNVWETGRVIEALRDIESATGAVWAGDVEAGRWSLDRSADALHAMRSQSARSEADQMRLKSIRGTRTKTGPEMIGGKVPFAKSGGIPPGLFTYRDRRMRQSVLAIDTPSNYPAPDQVEKYLPNVRGDDGELVDQVATIRWFLSQYGRPGVTLQMLFEGLLSRRYSTQALRNFADQGPAAYYGGPTQPVSSYASDPAELWTRSILNNLYLYETGVLERSFGFEEDASLTVTNVFPPDGPWAKPEDFERIRQKRSADEVRVGTIVQWSWSGMPVVVDGKPAILRGSPRRATGEMFWTFSRRSDVDRTEASAADDADGKRTRGPRVPPISDKHLTGAIVSALVKADGRPLTPMLREERPEDALAPLERRLSAVDQQVHAARQAQDRRYTQMMETDPARAPKGSLLERIQAEYYDLEEELARLALQRNEVERRIEAIAGARVGLDVTSMSALVAGLRNPYSNAYREALREGVQNLIATTRRFRRGKFHGVEVTLRGDLVISSSCSKSAWVVPFETTYSTGPAAEADERALRALARLRAGTVARLVNHGQVHASSMLAAELLGVPSTQFAIGACNEPLLLELAMAALFPSPGRGEEPAGIPSLADLEVRSDMVEAFGDVPALVRRIREVHTGRLGKQWIAQNGVKSETLALIRMATGQASNLRTAEEAALVRNLSTTLSSSLHKRPVKERWEFRRGHWPTLTPCAHCGGTAAASMRIKEVSGYLCLNPKCRRDMAGVAWPSHFDQYICLAELWLAAGVSLDLPDDFDPNPKRMKGAPVAPIIKKETKHRRLADIPDAERQEIARDYDERRKTVVNIAAEHHVSTDTIYALARQAGLPPRNQGRAKW